MKLQCEVAKNHHRMVFLQHRSVLGVLFVLEHRPWCSIGAPGCPNAWCSEDTKKVSVGHSCFNSVNLCDPVSQYMRSCPKYRRCHKSMRSCVTNICDPVSQKYAILCHNICDPVSQIYAMSQIYAILCHNICDPVSQIYAMLQIYAILCHKYIRCYTRLCDPVSQICAMLHASMRYCFTNMCDVTHVYAILCHKYVRCYTRLCGTVSQICAMLHASMRSQIYSMLHASMRYCFTNMCDVTRVYAILFHKYAILFHKYVRSIKDIDCPYRRYLELIFATFRVP